MMMTKIGTPTTDEEARRNKGRWTPENCVGDGREICHGVFGTFHGQVGCLVVYIMR